MLAISEVHLLSFWQRERQNDRAADANRCEISIDWKKNYEVTMKSLEIRT